MTIEPVPAWSSSTECAGAEDFFLKSSQTTQEKGKNRVKTVLFYTTIEHF